MPTADTTGIGSGRAGLVDVAIVGAGPVGCVLALLLADRGRRVVLVERWPAPYPLPRAVHFDDETARILQACGLGSVLPGLSESADVYEWQNGQGVPLLRLDTSGRGRSGWPSANMFNQPDLEAELQARVEWHPMIEIRRGREAVGIEERGEAVEVSLRATGAASGAADVVGARYVVGCDGANSFVRGALGIEMEDHGYFFDWLIVDVALHEPREFDPVNLQICDPHRPTTAVSGGPGRRRWEFMCLPGEELDALDDADRALELLATWDVTPENATMVRHAGYRFQARWALRWSEGHVFLAGDAAHQTPPFAGQGMCTGIRDAANLAWKLDLALDDPERAGILATYDEERIPHAAAVIGFAIELGKIICVPDAAEAGQRDALMAPLAAGGVTSPNPGLPGLTAGVLALGTPGAGELFVQGTVSDGLRTGRFDDVIGTGWVLIAAARALATVPTDNVDWFRSIGSVVTIGPQGSVEDVDGTYSAWMEARAVDAVIQRPDFSVYGSATTSSLAELLAALRSTLTGIE